MVEKWLQIRRTFMDSKRIAPGAGVWFRDRPADDPAGDRDSFPALFRAGLADAIITPCLQAGRVSEKERLHGWGRRETGAWQVVLPGHKIVGVFHGIVEPRNSLP